MGTILSMDIAELVKENSLTLDAALDFMMKANFYPPLPSQFKPVFKKAIELAADGDFDANVELPLGITYKDKGSAPVWSIIDGFHLEYLVDAIAGDGCTDD